MRTGHTGGLALAPRRLHATNSTRILSSQTLSLPTHATPCPPPLAAVAGPVGAAARRQRNWADMPLDAIFAVFHKLDHIDILMAADQVCSSWRRAARDEPALWRRIVMRSNADLYSRINRQGIACDAVRRSAGQCEAFCGEYAGDAGFLLYLSEQAPCLKSLRLISCDDISLTEFAELIRRFPLLEELELSECPELLVDWSRSLYPEVYEVLGQACPQLKHFRMNKQYFDEQKWGNNDTDAEGIAAMHELRSLQLVANDLTNKGLAAILENCPRLESLDIRHCFNVKMDDDDGGGEDHDGTLLREKCARIKTLRLPGDSTHDYHLEVQSPRFACKERGWSISPVYYSPWLQESEEDDDDFYRSPSRYEADLDKYEKVLPRSMRTFL
ncbi:putative F-box/LRR-repeat protein 23 [Triticum dicoccoides]|uniref:putative F-box/LRR-repeat protein 23 n=1 Tax=Triticum dicoccoides TaxID=85692 RepID=UPI001890CEC9|nr:putative F-box/LRR-repeat protein 23 [Triticum dicoccoides]